MLRYLILFLVLLVFRSCDSQPQQNVWCLRDGYYYKLISFESEHKRMQDAGIALIDATFSTQYDSVFWDSYNNLPSGYFIQLNGSSAGDYLAHEISMASELDSFVLLLPAETFFRQQFGIDELPVFCNNDSVVKLHVKVRAFLTESRFMAIQKDLAREELEKINVFFGGESRADSARHPDGFYWIEKPSGIAGTRPRPGERINIWYRGYYLNSRMMDIGEDSLTLRYGEPMQLLKGLNFVMSELKTGESAKIIIPSPLAYGDSGNTSGLVPPFTPLIYEIGINSEK